MCPYIGMCLNKLIMKCYATVKKNEKIIHKLKPCDFSGDNVIQESKMKSGIIVW